MYLQSLASRALLCLLAGSAFTLGLSPFDIKWLALISMSGLALALHQQTWRQGLLLGWIYGVGFFGAGVSWVYVSINVYGNAPFPLALTLTALFCGGLALLTACQAALFCAVQPRNTIARILTFSGLWMLFEWLRTWLLTGFPWSFAGYIALDTPLAGWAPITGIFGLSLLIAMTAAALAELLAKPRLKGISYLAAWSSLIVFSGYLLSSVQWTTASSEAQKVAVYQPNMALRDTWDRNNAPRFLADFQQHATDYAGEVDLIVWPEGALPFYFDQAPSYMETLRTIASANDTTIVTGMPTREGDSRFNSIVSIDETVDSYNKQKLVPFGEFVPLESALRGLIDFFDLPMSNFSRGSKDQSPLPSSLGKLAPFICYEIVYPDFVARGSHDSGLLITISNDAWFGTSHGPHQHFQMARFRALELQKPLIRGANNGITAIVDFRGRITADLPQFDQATLLGTVTPRTGSTPYARSGSLPIVSISLFFLVFISIKAKRQKR